MPPSEAPSRRASAAEIIAGVQARIDAAGSDAERRKIIASAHRSNDYRWAKAEQREERRMKADIRRTDRKNADREWHRRKRKAEASRWVISYAERMPALPVDVARAHIEQGRLSAPAYKLALWLIARSSQMKSGVWTDGFGSYRIEDTAFDLAADFGVKDPVEHIRHVARSTRWQEALIRLPNRGLQPLIEEAQVVRSKVSPGYAIEFKLPVHIDVLANARTNPDFSRTHPYCRFMPSAAAHMDSLSELRFYAWCSTHRAGVYRHWKATPWELRRALGLQLNAPPGHVDRALDAAIEALPKSVMLRPQWSPLKRRGRIYAYEFQLVPLYQDVRRLVWRWESVVATEDKWAFLKSIDLQIGRYRRNVARVDDADKWFRKWIGRRYASRKHFEALLDTLRDDVAKRLERAEPEAVPMRKLDELDRPRLRRERYRPFGEPGSGAGVRIELPLPAAEYETYGEVFA